VKSARDVSYCPGSERTLRPSRKYLVWTFIWLCYGHGDVGCLPLEK
jgi:hypothetical protein